MENSEMPVFDTKSTSVFRMPEAQRSQKYDPEKPLLLGMTDGLASATRAFAVVSMCIITGFVSVFACSDPDLLAALIYFGVSFLFLLSAIYILLTPNRRYLVVRGRVVRFSLFNRMHAVYDVAELDRVRVTQYDILVQRDGKTVMRFPINGRWDNQIFLHYLEDRLGNNLTLQAPRAYPISCCLTGIGFIAFGVIRMVMNGFPPGFPSSWFFFPIGALLTAVGIFAYYNRVTVEREGVTVRRLFSRTQTLLFSEVECRSGLSVAKLGMKSYRVSFYSGGKRLLTLFRQTEGTVERLKEFPWKPDEP